MKTVVVDFGGRWWHHLLGRGSRWERTGLLVLLAFAAAALGGVAWQRQVLADEQAQVQAQLARARAAAAAVDRPVVRPPAVQTPADTLRQMDAAVGRLNVPWSAVFDAIERNAQQPVALLALEPDARAGTVGLTVEARSLDDLLRYAHALGQDAAMASVRLGQHDQRLQEPGQPVRMTLSINPVPLQP